LQRLLQGLREDGVERVLLEVRESNQVAHKLYQSGGFREVGQRRGYYPSGQGREDAKVMLLDLY
jgi:ribosomal-protein-alanine N-acetyltransferase